MDTAIYYGLSTVAQVLASAFGFLVAVTLYRMDSIAESIRIWSGFLREALKRWERSGPDAQEQVRDHYMAMLESQEGESESLKAVKARLLYSMRWTAGTITACLVLMPITPLATGRGLWVLWASLYVVVGVAVYTLSTYIALASEVTD